LRELQGHTDWIRSVAFSPDGNRIVSGSDDESVRVWDAETGEQLRELQGHTDSVSSVAFSPDGDQVISGSFDKSVRVWDVETGQQLRELQSHTDSVRSVAFSPDGNRIVSDSQDKSVRVWDNLVLDAQWVLEEGGWILSSLFGFHQLSAMSCSVHTTHSSYLGTALQQSPLHNANLGPTGTNVIHVRCC